MRQPLDRTQRNQLERAVIRARDLVEQAAREALTRLGVAAPEAPGYLNDDERKLRNRLRAHARQLGDKLENGHQQTKRLIAEVGYEHWHRMLFAHFLEQNGLLMYDQYTAVSWDELKELVEEEPDYKDEWEMAADLAQKMLPQIFRTDSPVFEIKISTDQRRDLEGLITDLPPAVFQAQDSLGWCYQFWQSKRKEEVNKSGVKIGAEELSPVTQLFTEPYMVSFLLDNALGAWWANKRLTESDLYVASSEQELRNIAAIPGVPLEYLRIVKTEGTGTWSIASGGFEQWPEHLGDLKTLDPCCGSGHFLVALFLMLVPMRMELENLHAVDAINAVLCDNIHGLELDQRCVEIAVFALALEAWRYPNAGGYRPLPVLQIACSGVPINEAQKEWKEISKENQNLSKAVSWMVQTFQNAPTLGSLIIPEQICIEHNQAPWELLQQAATSNLNAINEVKAVAQGLAKSCQLLSSRYHFICTNPPYLGAGKQGDILKNHIEQNFYSASGDIATVFMARIAEMLSDNGCYALVTPQNWTFATSYMDFRKQLLSNEKFNLYVKIGEGGFESPAAAGAFVVLSIISKCHDLTNKFYGVDLSSTKGVQSKIDSIKSEQLTNISQATQLVNPDSRILLSDSQDLIYLSSLSKSLQGIKSGDDSFAKRCFWELMDATSKDWVSMRSTVETSSHFGGSEFLIRWDKQGKNLARLQGQSGWGKPGIAVSLMRELRSSLYSGEKFDSNIGVIIPNSQDQVLAIWCYVESKEFNKNVRDIDPRVNAMTGSLVKVPFDQQHWFNLSQEQYPNGLPKPYTNDPTQWIFHGHPCGSVIWDEEQKWTAKAPLRTDDTVLQVAVARLLGYRWPAELDKEMELAEEMRHWVDECVELHDLVDDDGIVCLPAIRGEKTAAARVEAMLQAAYDNQWSAKVLHDLLQSVGSKNLETWLRDKFFEQHCKLFQHRPFIWQIWDGLKDGFSALVNYHQLDYKGLERLIYTYLGEWIRTQEHGVKEGIDGADNRLMAANNLKTTLEAILKGEAITGKSGLDIFVRWKPLHQQPMGWHPDLNDGVRLNIRPFMQAPDVGKKGAGILRTKPNIKWTKDRGTDVASAPWYKLGLEYGEKEGARINDHHVSLADKQKARESAGE